MFQSIIVPLFSGSSSLLVLLDPEDGDTTFIQNTCPAQHHIPEDCDNLKPQVVTCLANDTQTTAAQLTFTCRITLVLGSSDVGSLVGDVNSCLADFMLHALTE
jgi:hypothetical protein